jgi:hypothetical protein
LEWLCSGAFLLAKAKEQRGVADKTSFTWKPLAWQFHFDPRFPVTVLAGITKNDESARLEGYEAVLRAGLSNYVGTLVSGATTAGVCGLAARLASPAIPPVCASIQLVGYVPEQLPRGADIDPAFKTVVRTAGAHDFSPVEPIQMWIDLVMSGIDPESVQLLCIGGSELSALELALAWALGARSAVVNDSSIASRRFTDLLDWAGEQTDAGMLVPDDPTSLTAFFAFDVPIDAKQWEKSGEAVHQAYVKSQQKGTNQPNMLPWPLLRDDFKHSNRHQAACSVEILRHCGFIVERSTLAPEQIPLSKFSDDQIEQLAEWEHGRWNVERLKSGWRFGEKKDEARKLSHYLVSWQELPDAIKNYDRAAVRDWPAILAQAGWQIKQP